jgi:hypothetical protein
MEVLRGCESALALFPVSEHLLVDKELFILNIWTGYRQVWKSEWAISLAIL